MGNKSTFFIILFFVIGFFTSEGFATCGDRPDACYSRETYRVKKICVYSIASCDQPSTCRNNQGSWVGGKCVSKTVAPTRVLSSQYNVYDQVKTTSSTQNSPTTIKERTCNGADGTPVSCATLAQSTVAPSNNPATSCGDKATETALHEGQVVTGGPNVLHRDCQCKFTNAQGNKDIFIAGYNTAVTCPDSDLGLGDKSTETAAKADAKGLDCIQTIRDEINTCKEKSSEAVIACDMKSQKNAETKQGLSALSQASQQFIHAGTAEQCKNMGLVTSAAGYGLSEIQDSCRNEMKACRNSCTGLYKYKNPENIKAYCKSAASEDVDRLQSEADQLAQVMSKADNECVDNTEQLLQQVGSAIGSATSAYATSAQCERQLSSSPVLTTLDLNACLSNPNAAGCPVNCASNPSNAQCTCLVNPNAAGCKGGPGVSELASGKGPQFTPTGVTVGGSQFGPSPGSGGGLDLSLNDDSEKVPAEQKPAVVTPTESLFGKAGEASAGSGGSTQGGDDGAKNKNGKAAVAEEDKGLFGGVFKNLKNAAGSLFGSGGEGSSSTKKSSSAKGAANSAGLKPVVSNSALRGIASNGKSCFVDSKGVEFCFGRKNMDIFKMMNSQYSNQYSTLINDK